MEYYDVKQLANEIGRKSGVACAGALALVIISLNQGLPEWYMWLAIGIFGVVVYEVVSTLILPYLLNRYADNRQEYSQAQVEIKPTYTYVAVPDEHYELAERAINRAPEWVNTVDWQRLHQYVSQPRAPLSRAALADLVDQRFYSPRDDDPTMSFPDLMVEIGAALRVTNGGDKVSYSWTKRAPVIIGALADGLRNESPLLSPSPNGTVK